MLPRYCTLCRLAKRHQPLAVSLLRALRWSCRFNVYVSQPEVKPGCVLRRSNVNVLESRKLVSSQEVGAAWQTMHTLRCGLLVSGQQQAGSAAPVMVGAFSLRVCTSCKVEKVVLH